VEFVDVRRVGLTQAIHGLRPSGAVDEMRPASRPTGVLASLVRPNRLSCRFVARPNSLQANWSNPVASNLHPHPKKTGPFRAHYFLAERVSAERGSGMFP